MYIDTKLFTDPLDKRLEATSDLFDFADVYLMVAAWSYKPREKCECQDCKICPCRKSLSPHSDFNECGECVECPKKPCRMTHEEIVKHAWQSVYRNKMVSRCEMLGLPFGPCDGDYDDSPGRYEYARDYDDDRL